MHRQLVSSQHYICLYYSDVEIAVKVDLVSAADPIHLCQGNRIKAGKAFRFHSELQAQISVHSSLAPGLGRSTTRTTGSLIFTKLKKKKKSLLQKPRSFTLFSFSHCSCRVACLTTPQHHPPASAASQRPTAMTAQKPLIKSQL